MIPRFLAALVLAAAPMVPWGPAIDLSQWDGNYDGAIQAARREFRSTVVYFTLPLDQTSHETFIRLKTDPRLVDAMDRMVRVVLEEPDAGIAYGRYRIAEFPALVVLDPGGAMVSQITVTPHSDAWVHQFLAACREAHTRAAHWVRPVPPIPAHLVIETVSRPRHPPARRGPPHARAKQAGASAAVTAPAAETGPCVPPARVDTPAARPPPAPAPSPVIEVTAPKLEGAALARAKALAAQRARARAMRAAARAAAEEAAGRGVSGRPAEAVELPAIPAPVRR